MKRNRKFCTAPFLTAALGVVFCVWTALGNDINLCVTAGCQLYQSASIAGVSLWWIGSVVFAFLGILALAGLADLGCLASGLVLAGDIGLLLLMALTAPCVACLVAAVFFALIYFFYQLEVSSARISSSLARKNDGGRRSIILMVWLLLFVVNLGAVVRSQTGLWPILDSDDNVGVRMFFSPSCPSCQKGVAALSGRVDVAFYPLAENDSDVYKVAAMQGLLDAGMSMADALREVQNAGPPSGIGQWFDQVFLRWHLLRNKAHVFSAGAQTVPFFEYRGLPRSLELQAGRHGMHSAGPVPGMTDPAGSSVPAQGDLGGQSLGTTNGDQRGTGEARMRQAFPGDASLPFDDPSVPLVSGRCGESARCLPAPEKKPVQKRSYGQRPARTRAGQNDQISANQPGQAFPGAE